MVYISLWSTTLELLAAAARLLRAGDPLFLHAPFHRADQPTGPSHETFEASLKTRNSLWGLRDGVTVIVAADGSTLTRVVQMPANIPWVVLQRNSLQTWPMAVRGTAARHDLFCPTTHKLTLQGIPPAELRTLIQ
ncbi:hypothetical protein J3A66_003474 [Sphingomonas sp. PvP018]|nr:hypothetical protein [Sphingomonas sp. PvP018]